MGAAEGPGIAIAVTGQGVMVLTTPCITAAATVEAGITAMVVLAVVAVAVHLRLVMQDMVPQDLATSPEV
jgi:hypothetical protein